MVVEGASRGQIVPALDDVCRRLARRGDLFGAVMHRTDAPKLRAKGLYYLDVQAKEPAEAASCRSLPRPDAASATDPPLDLQQIEANLDRMAPLLQGDWSQMSLAGMARSAAAGTAGTAGDQQRATAAMRAQLPQLIDGLAAALGPSGAPDRPRPDVPAETAASAATMGQDAAPAFRPSASGEPASDRLIAEDGRMGFVLLRLLEEDKQGFAQNEKSIGILRQLTAEVTDRYAGVKIGLTGLPIIEFDEMHSSEQSMSLATLLSFFGVLAVMIVAFGGFRHATMAMGALVLAMVWACGCVALTIGHVNVLSIAFGSILVGLGIDYGIYFVARYLQLRRNTESTEEALVATAGSTGPGILTGALTSAIAFFAAGLTDFPGVAQLGIIAGVGILLCWLAEAAVLPAMIRLSDADGAKEHLPLPLNLRFWLAPLFAYPRLTLLLVAAGTVLAAAGMSHLRYDYNLLNLEPVGLESVDLEQKLFHQANQSAWFALSIADTPEQVAVRKAAFLRLPSVERVVEIASKLPCDILEKRPIVARISQRLANLPREVPELPVLSRLELDRLLAGAEAMFATTEMATAAHQLRQTIRQISEEECQRRVPAISAKPGRRGARQAARATGGGIRRAAGTGRLARERHHALHRQDRSLPDAGLRQGEHLGGGADGPVRRRRPHGRPQRDRQSGAGLRGLPADENQLPAGGLLRPADDRAGGAAGFPPGRPYAAGGAADGRRPAPDARADGPAGHSAEPGEHDRLAADAGHRHGKRHQPGPRAALPARTLSRRRQRGGRRRGGQFIDHHGRLRSADDRQPPRAAKPGTRAHVGDGLLPALLPVTAQSAGARPVRRGRGRSGRLG